MFVTYFFFVPVIKIHFVKGKEKPVLYVRIYRYIYFIEKSIFFTKAGKKRNKINFQFNIVTHFSLKIIVIIMIKIRKVTLP